MTVSLAEIPAADVHCHGWRSDELQARDPSTFLDRTTMLGTCLISSDRASLWSASRLREITDGTLFSQAMQVRLAEMLDCEPTRDAVSHTRQRALTEYRSDYFQRLWATAGVSELFVDEGYPLPAIPASELAADARIAVHRVARIEPWIDSLTTSAASYQELEEGLRAAAESAVAEGAIAFKSIIAYRTGLEVREVTLDEAGRAFGEWRADDFRESQERSKPVRDRLLEVALEVAGRHGLPFHIHCGGGNPSVVLERARPAGLLGLLNRHPGQPIVLIHGGWPWTEEAAFLASVLPHVYIDLSIMTGWSSVAMDQKLEVILGTTSAAQIMHGSDEASEPEVIWLAALAARESLERVLSTAVERRWMTEAAAHTAGVAILGGNARRLHGVG